MDNETKLHLEERVVEMLRTVFDPEIPVDIYSLGLVYRIDIDDDANLNIDMTLTAPNCPAADFIIEDARIKLESISELKSVNINIVFEPEWTRDMMSEEPTSSSASSDLPANHQRLLRSLKSLKSLMTLKTKT